MRAFLATMLGVLAVTFAVAWIGGGMAATGPDPGMSADQELAPIYALVCTAVAAATWLTLATIDRIRRPH
jgi:hypothetical protein